ncbi:MAG: Methionine synthase vitamin-B12 independent [Pseudonocardia sp.]|jgi:5-methyltetrahydropteroyltriglutamate--homocysteine methyltransferase|nr:Methionine synthase vitamin-B12 independent [Pseudonocardia sp.]
MKVRGQDVLLPATLVGAYPRPIYMEGKVFPVGVRSPEYESYRKRELYQLAVSAAVHDMQDVGLDIVTDGGQYYENETGYEYAELFHAMAHKLDGYAGYGDRIQVGAFDLPIYKPTVLGDVAWRRPVFKPVAEAVREVTDAPLKINASLGPATLAALSTDQHYHDLKALSQDVAKAYNAEFKDLERRGVDMIQITEPLTFFEPEDWIIEAINTAFDGVDAYKVVHICYGHEEGQPGILDLKADRLFPWAFDLNCNQIHFQMASHEFSEVESLRGWPADKDLGVGVVDIELLRVETPEQIAGWLHKLFESVPPEQVSVSTDCGIASMRRNVAKAKLGAIVAGRDLAKSQLTGN